jgi:DNA-binding NtrC family response regulator
MQHTLLIVDDDRSLARMLGWSFEDLGYRVIIAADCCSAYRALGCHRPGYALIDFCLPDGDGHTLWRDLAKRLPNLKTVLMSADREAAQRAIGNDPRLPPFIEKPVRLTWLNRYFSSADETPASSC